jgi:hypothetical protein
MRSGLEERRERGSFGLSTAVGRLDDQRLKGVGFLSGSKVSAKVCPAIPPPRSELTEVFQRSGTILPIPTELLAGCRQFAPDPSPKQQKPPRQIKFLQERLDHSSNVHAIGQAFALACATRELTQECDK